MRIYAVIWLTVSNPLAAHSHKETWFTTGTLIPPKSSMAGHMASGSEAAFAARPEPFASWTQAQGSYGSISPSSARLMMTGMT